MAVLGHLMRLPQLYTMRLLKSSRLLVRLAPSKVDGEVMDHHFAIGSYSLRDWYQSEVEV